MEQPKNLQLRNLPSDVNDILLNLQAKKLSEKKVLISKENLIYQIVREWGKGKPIGGKQK